MSIYDESDAAFTILGVFDPTFGVSGCLVAVYSDLGVTKDGSDRVGTWADQVNTNNFTQATDAKKFVYYATTGPNGYPELRSDGSDDFMSIPSFTLTETFHIFLVFKASNESMLFEHSANWNSNAGAGLHTTVGVVTDKLGGYQDITPAGNFSVYNLIELSFNNAIHTLKFYRNGVLIDTSANADWTGCGDRTKELFLASRAGADYFMAGSFVAKLIYNSQLSDADRAIIQNGLNARYALWTP